MSMKMSRRRWTPASLALAALAAAGCATNPATGERQLALISESQEVEMGRAYAEQVESTMAVYDDPELQAYVERVGLELAAVSERPDLPWSFKIIDDPVVNAFALPGGFIYVTRGIVAQFNSEAELAAVLGHEIGHVTARHSVEQMSRQQLTGLLLGVGSVLSEDVARFGGLAQAGLGVLFLSYGREDEHQADMLGVRYALRESYDPREAVEVHRMLQRQTEARGGSGVPTWLATHPSSLDRIDRLSALIDTIPASRLSSTRVRADEYLAQVDGMVYGPNPRHGYFEGPRFLHPDLAFTLTFPSGWQTMNLSQSVVAQAPSEDAILQLVLAGSGHAAAARAFFSQDGIRSRNVTTRQVNGHPATTGQFEARLQDGTLEGMATFIDYDGRTYRILGYTVAGRLGAYTGQFGATTGSFDRLTDRAALAVEPMRIDVLTVQRQTSLRDMAAARRAPVPVEELAIMNGVTADEDLAPGTGLKWVVGDPPPGS